MAVMKQLLPCPFCGNDGSGPIEEALHIAFTEHDWRGPSWTVQCDKCTATMGYLDSEDAVIEAWNTRINLAADVLIEAERRGAERMRERAALLADADALYQRKSALGCDCWKQEQQYEASARKSAAFASAIRALPLTEETINDDA